MDQIRSLYEQEIEAYKGEMNSLRLRSRECDAKNLALISQLKSLEEVLQQTKQANNDLRTAYQHIHEENIKLQVPALSQPELQPPAITDSSTRGTQNDAGEILSWVSDRDRLNQRVKFLERECVRYQRDNTTLGKQVRHLLRALEEERGMIIPQRSQQGQDGPVVSAADVIDKHLVTFSSIEQLQQQNQQLLSIVKDLSAEQELADAKIESDEVKRLTAQVEELSDQLESIKSDRERVLSTLNTMHKERDLFKILLCKTREAQNMTPQIFQRMVSVACSSGPAIEDTVTKLAEKDEHIKDLRDVNTRLHLEIETHKKDMSDLRQETNEEIKLKENLLQQAHFKILEESKRADILNDRNEILEKNIEALTREHDELRVKCSKITFEMSSANEETAAKLAERDEHMKDLRNINTRLQQEIDSYKKDISDLRQEAQEEIKIKESRLQQAYSDGLNEKTRADFLTDQNQTLLKNVETLEKHIEALEKNTETLEKNIETLEKNIETLETNIESRKRNIESGEKNIGTLEKNIETLEKNLEVLSRERDELRAKIDNEELRVKTEKLASDDSNLNQLRRDLDNLQHQFFEMQDLRNQEREMRLDLDYRCRLRSRKELKANPRTKSNSSSHTTTHAHPPAEQPEPMKHQEPQEELHQEPQEQREPQEVEVKPAPPKAITLKRRNLR